MTKNRFVPCDCGCKGSVWEGKTQPYGHLWLRTGEKLFYLYSTHGADKNPILTAVKLEEVIEYIEMNFAVPPRVVNLNEKVSVVLTDHGREYLGKWLDKLVFPPSLRWSFIKPPDATYEFQLWEIMQIFGDQMYAGNPKQMFVDNSITLLEEK